MCSSRKILSTLLGILMTVGIAQAQQNSFSRAKVYADEAGMETMESMGICTDHGTHKKGVFFISDFSSDELQTITDLGYNYEVLIPDVKAFYQQRIADNIGKEQEPLLRGGDPCASTGGGNDITYTTPNNYNGGSMGGFLTYSEFIAEIDDMAAQYPNLITSKAPISNFQTHEGRDIYWLRISDNPTVDENEPEILYTSLIHAREPASLAELMFYMWYLLENYGTNAEVTHLVDNTEMYFVPMINPDGYIQNEINDPNGGGLWRKNMRNNAGSNCDGVDLNRNFSYQYGASGVSGNPCADNYLGPNAFSEPETQAIKWLCENRDFQVALNYHSFGDLLLFPFGYASIQTPDYDQQLAWATHMTQVSGHIPQLSADLYPAAGDSDDWMYAGDLGTKPKIFAFTPEVGDNNQGFWPNPSQIEGIAESLMWQNLNAAWLVLDLPLIEDLSPATVSSLTGNLEYDLTRMGLLDGSTYTVSITPVGPELISVGPANTHAGMNVMDNLQDQIAYTLDPSLAPGSTFQYELEVTNGTYTWSQTITKTYGTGPAIFADNADNTTEWSGGWGVSNSVFYTPSGSIHDSPNGDYQDQDVNTMELNTPIDLTNAISANMTFWTRWEIEEGWDYVQLQASTNGTSGWTPLCGRYTVIGNGNQDTGNPLWDGFQTDWVQEEINLQDYLGQTVYLRFRLVSDQAVHEDGFYYDDVIISAVIPGAIDDLEEAFYVSQNMPNPASTFTLINYELPQGATEAWVTVHNTMGQMVSRENINPQNQVFRLETGDLTGGVYFYTFETAEGLTVTRRFSVVR